MAGGVLCGKAQIEILEKGSKEISKKFYRNFRKKAKGISLGIPYQKTSQSTVVYNQRFHAIKDFMQSKIAYN